MRAVVAAVCLAAPLVGCDADPSPAEPAPEEHEVAFRCSSSDLPALGGLTSVTLSGKAAISGNSGEFDIFSNGKISIGATTSVSGGVSSASGAVELLGVGNVLGDIVKSASDVPAYLPTGEASFIDAYRHHGFLGNTSAGRRAIDDADVLTMYDGDTLSLNGYYYALDGLSLSGGAELDLYYSVTYLFVDGPVSISGGASLGTSRARHLLLVSMSDDPIVISGASTSFLGRIYAPLAPITITDGASLTGAAVGASLQVSGGATVEVTQDGLHIWYPC